MVLSGFMDLLNKIILNGSINKGCILKRMNSNNALGHFYSLDYILIPIEIGKHHFLDDIPVLNNFIGGIAS